MEVLGGAGGAGARLGALRRDRSSRPDWLRSAAVAEAWLVAEASVAGAWLMAEASVAEA